jgi:outer membrane protein TolC
MNPLFGIAIALLLFFGNLHAQEEVAWSTWRREMIRPSELLPLPPQATLAAYSAYAQLNNPGVEAALARWRSALEQVSAARAWADPRLTLGYFAHSVETRVGPQQQRFGLAQAVPWPDKLDLCAQAALALAEVQRWRYAAARSEVVFATVDAYFTYYYLERAIAVTEGNMQLVAYLEEVVRARYRGGAEQYGALIKAQVELGRLEDRLYSLRDQLRPAAAALNSALGRPVNAAVAVIDSPATREFYQEALRDSLRLHNPQLQLRRSALRGAELAVELAKKESRPDLTLGLDYVRTGKGAGVAKDSGKDPLVLMASVNLPIWRDKYRAAVRAAVARQHAARDALQDREGQLLARMEMALYQWRESERKKTLYRDNLIYKAEQAFNVTQQAFAVGKSSFLDLIDAQRILLEFQLAYEKARADGARHAALIDQLVGWPQYSRSDIKTEFDHAKDH